MPELRPPTSLTDALLEQLTFHWEAHLRPRLEGLTDEEYLWEPVAGCWSLRPTGPGGVMVADFEVPEPDPAPVTTIAWRMGHLIAGVFGARNHSHFGGAEITYETIEWPVTAAAALAMLDDGYTAWVAGVAALSDDGLAAAVGEAEGPFAAFPMRDLVLHIHREVIHHGAEILVLRDLWRSRPLDP